LRREVSGGVIESPLTLNPNSVIGGMAVMDSFADATNLSAWHNSATGTFDPKKRVAEGGGAIYCLTSRQDAMIRLEGGLCVCVVCRK
jgi:hypothetical protein